MDNMIRLIKILHNYIILYEFSEVIQMSKKEYDVFISHASEDKHTIVRELAESLSDLGVRVWYDEFSLEVGDSLTQKIDEGLINSKFGIIIVSKSFIKKKWADYELRSLLSKEDNYTKVILPVWHEITYDEVKNFSLYLADKFSLDTSKLTVLECVNMLLKVIRPDIYENLLRRTLFNEIRKTSKVESIEINKIVWGEKLRDSLPQNLINRIKSFHYSFIENYIYSDIEKTMECYLYEHDPIREIEVFEILNASFLEFVELENIIEESVKRDIAVTLLGFSMGIIREDIQLIDYKIEKLFEVYKSNFI